MNPYLLQITNHTNEYVVQLADIAAASPHGTIVKPCIVIAHDAWSQRLEEDLAETW
jgi:hypothetical protein